MKKKLILISLFLTFFAILLIGKPVMLTSCMTDPNKNSKGYQCGPSYTSTQNGIQFDGTKCWEGGSKETTCM